MKLKYYLRGLGMGILFATLVMTISSVIHNNNLSEEKIIKEAKKLGMIMPEEETESGGLFASKEDTEVEGTETVMPETESMETDSTEKDSSEAESTETTPVETESEEPVTEPETPVSTEVGDKTYIQIQIHPGSAARRVAETLYENGLIEDVEEFRVYMGTAGYAEDICVGEFLIPIGATYEEICTIITTPID